MTFQHPKPAPAARLSARIKVAVLLGATSSIFLLFAVLYGVTAWTERANAIALAAGPRVEGRIVSIGAGGVPSLGAARPLWRGIIGEIEFPVTSPSQETCRARVSFGRVLVRVGQSLTVVPVGNSCDRPVIEVGREPAGPYFLGSLINAAAAIILGVLAWWVARPRSAA